MSTSKNRCYALHNPVKSFAHAEVQKAIRDGGLVRPDTCTIDGCSNLHPLAHHADYSKPLEVEWWCASCHAKFHKFVNNLQVTA